MYLTAQLCNARDRNYIVYAKRRERKKERRRWKDKGQKWRSVFC